MPIPTDPLRPVDDDARHLARRLLAGAATASLAFLEADGAPFVSRIAWATSPDGGGLTFVSDLATHTAAMRRDPRVSLLLGEPSRRGDPLNHPRLSVRAVARFVATGAPDWPGLRDHWLRLHPKARLYIGFSDFSFVRFALQGARLNAGFGKAYALAPEDLTLP